MKKILILSLFAAIILQSCGVTRRMQSREPLTVTPSRLDLVVNQSGFPYTVNVNFIINIPRGYVTTCAQLVITPFFTDGVNTMALTPLYINGRTFNRIERRHARFGQPVTDYSNAVGMVAERGDMAVAINETVAFQPWMPMSQLVLTTSCVACDRATILTNDILAQGMEYFPPSLGPVIIEKPTPKPEPFISKESWIGRLEYPINLYVINAEVDGNAKQLATLHSLMERIMADPTLHITKIVTCGYASPDGIDTENMQLSQNRSEALKHYIISKYKVDPELIEVTAVGEDWNGLYEALGKSTLDGAQKLITDLKAASNNTQREIIMRRSPLFPSIRAHMLQPLRKVTCDIYYNKVN